MAAPRRETGVGASAAVLLTIGFAGNDRENTGRSTDREGA